MGALLGKGQDAAVFVKRAAKPANEEEGKEDGADADGYAPASASGLKKAKKLYEQTLKKKKKQEEQAKQQDVDGNEDKKRLEESKSVVLDKPTEEYKKVC